MTWFWILWWLVAAISAVALRFFVRGLRFARGNPRYFQAWAWVLGYLGIALAGSPWLVGHGMADVGYSLLALPAVLCVGYLLMLGVFVVGKGSFR